MILKQFYLNCLAHASYLIVGSVSMPLNHLGERLSELPTDRPLLVYCAGGYRSSIAASLLLRHGLTQVSEIAGGIAAWETARLPLQLGPDV
jgi:hydroxyacylglutathione hydrolase